MLEGDFNLERPDGLSAAVGDFVMDFGLVESVERWVFEEPFEFVDGRVGESRAV